MWIVIADFSPPASAFQQRLTMITLSPLAWITPSMAVRFRVLNMPTQQPAQCTASTQNSAYSWTTPGYCWNGRLYRGGSPVAPRRGIGAGTIFVLMDSGSLLETKPTESGMVKTRVTLLILRNVLKSNQWSRCKRAGMEKVSLLNLWFRLWANLFAVYSGELTRTRFTALVLKFIPLKQCCPCLLEIEPCPSSKLNRHS